MFDHGWLLVFTSNVTELILDEMSPSRPSGNTDQGVQHG